MPQLTIEHIAARSGVSRSTVSRVVNDDPKVSPEVRARVQRVIDECDYTPHAAARSLAGSPTKVICLLNVRGPDRLFSSNFMAPLVLGISHGCNNKGYFLLLSMADAAQAGDLYQRLVYGRHCDGIIMLASDVDDALLPRLVADQVPAVMIGLHPSFPQLNSVNVENGEGARIAVTHLARLGHQRIATITGQMQTSHAVERRDGYVAALREAGLSVAPELIVEGDLTGQSGYVAMHRLLELEQRPTAVFAADDAMAAGALRAIREAGLRVPQDIALVGFDDEPIATLTEPQLTTVRQPVHELGVEAAHLLISLLQGHEVGPVQKRLPVALVIRQSCGTPASD